jgi:uridine phosphorylase
VEKRLRSPPLPVSVSQPQQTTVVCGGGGLNKYQTAAADTFQRLLVPRSRFQVRLSGGVSCHLLFDHSVRGYKRKAMSQPIITPRKFLHAIYGRDALPPEVAGCTCAVVAFCQFGDMQHKLAAEPVPTSLFSLLHQTHQFIGHVAGRTLLTLENLQGGPLAATVIEELAHYGITQVLGYGYAGSLTRTVPIGQLVLAEDALISDGTSRAYLPQDARVPPDDALVQELRACAAQLRIVLRGATVWTTDALYREYPEDVAVWRRRGATVVNMDTAHFYAVSRVVGLSAAYACVVSDGVEAPTWDDGHQDIHHARGVLQDLIVATLSRMMGKSST